MAPTLSEGSDTFDKLERVSVFLSDLADFIKASPTSYHAAAEVGRRLAQAGFTRLSEQEPWQQTCGNYFVIRDGAVIAWRRPENPKPGFAIVGAHTDSPALKLKPNPDTANVGWQQVAMEVYGNPLLNSFLDRELGLAGRLVTADGKTHLVQTGPILRIPQLAIHLDRSANEALRLDKQRHLVPVLGLASEPVIAHLANCASLDPDDIYGHDIFSFPTQDPTTF
ncbi:MAG: M18 family aminopeptidase, partial [Propionibacterium sp.]